MQDRATPGDQAHDCVVALKALGEETRARIVGLLIEAPLDVSEIVARVGASPYNVSKHLRILREAGLLQVRKDGRRRLYALPAAMRRRAAGGTLLDLGCCSFQFDAGAPRAAGTKAGRTRPAAARRAAR